MKPTTLDIDGTPVIIEWSAKLGRFAQGYAKGGEHSPGHIRIAPGLTKRGERGTLVHELLHELWSRSALARWFPKEKEELVCDELAPWLVALLRANPKLLAYLGEDS